MQLSPLSAQLSKATRRAMPHGFRLVGLRAIAVKLVPVMLFLLLSTVLFILTLTITSASAVRKVGTDGDEALIGTLEGDTLLGFGGGDNISGLGGDDWLEGYGNKSLNSDPASDGDDYLWR